MNKIHQFHLIGMKVGRFEHVQLSSNFFSFVLTLST